MNIIPRCENCRNPNIFKIYELKGVNKKSIKLCPRCYELSKMMRNYLIDGKLNYVSTLYDTMARLFTKIHCINCRNFDYLRKERCMEGKNTGVGDSATHEQKRMYPHSYANGGCARYRP